MDALLSKDVSQMSYEELEKAARHYGFNEDSKVDLVQIDGLVSSAI
jgi:beta-lactam-binding protein with PASTA domain